MYVYNKPKIPIKMCIVTYVNNIYSNILSK